MASLKIKTNKQIKVKTDAATGRVQESSKGKGAEAHSIERDPAQLDTLAETPVVQGQAKLTSVASLQARSVQRLARELLEHPQEWLHTPNSQLGGRMPIELVGTREEFRVKNLLNAVDLGLF